MTVWVEARDDERHTVIHTADPQQKKNHLAPNVSRANVGRACSKKHNVLSSPCT